MRPRAIHHFPPFPSILEIARILSQCLSWSGKLNPDVHRQWLEIRVTTPCSGRCCCKMSRYHRNWAGECQETACWRCSFSANQGFSPHRSRVLLGSIYPTFAKCSEGDVLQATRKWVWFPVWWELNSYPMAWTQNRTQPLALPSVPRTCCPRAVEILIPHEQEEEQEEVSWFCPDRLSREESGHLQN